MSGWNEVGPLVGARSPWPLLTITVVQIQQKAVQQYSSTSQQDSSTAGFTPNTPSGGRRIDGIENTIILSI